MKKGEKGIPIKGKWHRDLKSQGVLGELPFIAKLFERDGMIYWFHP